MDAAQDHPKSQRLLRYRCPSCVLPKPIAPSATQECMESSPPSALAFPVDCLSAHHPASFALSPPEFGEPNILHHGPHDAETRCFGREGVDSIRALSHITKETFNSVRRSNV